MPDSTVHITEYDPTWPARAAAAIRELQYAFPNLLVQIEHIGSTAVPGMVAKPIIDLMAAATDLEKVEACEQRLAVLGYRRHRNVSHQSGTSLTPPARCDLPRPARRAIEQA